MRDKSNISFSWDCLFLRPNQEPYSLKNWSLTFANRQLYELLYLSCVIYDDRPGNKKTYQYELIRLQPINLVFAQNSTFCARVGGVVLKTCPLTVKTAPNIYFCGLPIHKQAWQLEDILQIMSLSFLLLWFMCAPQFECFDPIK